MLPPPNKNLNNIDPDQDPDQDSNNDPEQDPSQDFEQENFAPLVPSDLSELHALAEADFDRGDYEAALMHYLDVFEGSRELPAWQGARLNFLLADIAALGDEYPLAMKALVNLRDKRETAIFAGSLDPLLISEWSALNHQLEPERSIAVYFDLKSNPAFKKFLEQVRELDFAQFVAAGHYKEIDEGTLRQQFVLLVAEKDMVAQNHEQKESQERSNDSNDREVERDNYLSSALLVFECAAALNCGDIGKQTMFDYIEIQALRGRLKKPYAKLIEAANRAKNQTWVEGLSQLEDQG